MSDPLAIRGRPIFGAGLGVPDEFASFGDRLTPVLRRVEAALPSSSLGSVISGKEDVTRNRRN